MTTEREINRPQSPLQKARAARKVASVDESPPLMSNGRINYPNDFERFWALYPKKQQKGAAYLEWRRITQHVDKDHLVVAVVKFSEDMQQRLVEPKYIQNCRTWLSSFTFSDYLDQEDVKPILTLEFTSSALNDILTFCQQLSSISKSPELGADEAELIEYWNDVVQTIFTPLIHGSENLNEDVVILRRVASGEG